MAKGLAVTSMGVAMIQEEYFEGWKEKEMGHEFIDFLFYFCRQISVQKSQNINKVDPMITTN